MKILNISYFLFAISLICFPAKELFAQVTIGEGVAPHPSAVLELKADDKGFLGPRVALTSSTDQTTIPSPAEGLLVYNLGTAGLTYVGYTYWNGSEWRAVNSTNIVHGAIGSISCNGVLLTPNSYQAGQPFTGTLLVPYEDGNGGTYEAQTIGPVNGLTATLAAGNFNVGSGTLSYAVTGTPDISSPNTVTFPLNIGGQSCNAVVGDGSSTIALGELVYYVAVMDASPANVWLSSYVSDLPIIGGKLRLDAYFTLSSNQPNGIVTMFPRLVNVSSTPVKIWFSAVTTVDRFNAGNYLIAPSGYVELDNGIYLGYGFNDILGTSTPRASGSGLTGNQEVVTVDLSLEGKWYRIYYFPIVDNMNTATTADNQRRIHLSIQRLY